MRWGWTGRADAVVSLPAAAGWAHGAFAAVRQRRAGLWQHCLSPSVRSWAVTTCAGRRRRTLSRAARRPAAVGWATARSMRLFVGARCGRSTPSWTRRVCRVARLPLDDALARRHRCVGRERGHRDLLSPRAEPTEAAGGEDSPHPPIAGGGDPARVRALANAVAESGCHGAMVTLDPSNRESIEALGEELGRVQA